MQFDKILTEEVRKKTTDSVCFNLKLRKERKFTQIELFNQLSTPKLFYYTF